MPSLSIQRGVVCTLAILLTIPVLEAVPASGAGATTAPAQLSSARAAVHRVAWRPNAPVQVMVSSRARLFMGGDFNRMVNTSTHKSVRRVRIAALNRRTNSLIRSFHAKVNGTVRALAVFNRKLILGGDFTRVNGMQRKHFAALRLSDGRVVKSWHRRVNGPVLSLLHMGPRLYVGGNFNGTNGAVRSKLFALNLRGKLVAGWPNQGAGFTDGGAFSLAATPSQKTVLVGGAFHKLVGHNRNFLGAISRNGGVRAWKPRPACTKNCFVKDLAVGRTKVYAGIAGSDGGHAAAYQLNNARTAWIVNGNGDVDAISRSGTHLLVGGHFSKINGSRHKMFAELRASTGAATKRRLPTAGPRFPGILDIAVASGRALLGGAFKNVSGQRRLAAVPG